MSAEQMAEMWRLWPGVVGKCRGHAHTLASPSVLPSEEGPDFADYFSGIQKERMTTSEVTRDLEDLEGRKEVYNIKYRSVCMAHSLPERRHQLTTTRFPCASLSTDAATRFIRSRLSHMSSLYHFVRCHVVYIIISHYSYLIYWFTMSHRATSA